MRMVVVLPAPLGPMNPNRSPRLKFKLIDLMANNSPYFFVKSRVSIIEKLSIFASAATPNFHGTKDSSAPSPATQTDILPRIRPACLRPRPPFHRQPTQQPAPPHQRQRSHAPIPANGSNRNLTDS